MDVTTKDVHSASESELALISGFNCTAAEFPEDATLVELIERQFDSNPSKAAVTCEHDQALGSATATYAVLNKLANQLAHRLRTEGIGPGNVVALMVERSFAMLVGILGILKAGAAYLPLAPDHPAERLRFMIEDAGATTLLVQPGTAGKLAFDKLTINLNDWRPDEGALENLTRIATPQDLAYVIYTSGSTGRPKGVMVEHRAVVNRLYWMQRRYPIGDGDVILQKTPFFFDVSVWELLWSALAGARLAFLPPKAERNPFALIDTIKRQQVTVLHFVPSMLSAFLEYLAHKGDVNVASLASVKRVFASGEALTASHVKRFNDIWGSKTGARLTNLYGPTEAAVDVSYFDCEAHNNFSIVPIGRPIDNIRLYVVHNGQQAAIGESGELCIAGVGLARGYRNNPELTRERFTHYPGLPEERIYRTGDVARWLPDGNLEYLGRNDHQVKIRGLRIELGEIESVLREQPQIADCAVVVKTLQEGVVLVIAYLVCRTATDIDDLRAALRQRLPNYMIPNHFVKIDEMPLTSSGKANRKALMERAADWETYIQLSVAREAALTPPMTTAAKTIGINAPDGPATLGAKTKQATSTGPASPTAKGYTAPRNDLERSLTRACERVLGLSRVGINDNLFDLGAHSLTIIRLVVEIKQSTGLDLDVGEVFRSPSVAALVEHMGKDAKRNASIVIPLQPKGDGTPIFCLCGIDIYKGFALGLGEDQPVYGVYVDEERAIIDQALHGKAARISIERLVEAYYDAIVRYWPEGPYRLAGLSFGGLLATALACRMRAHGAIVDVVFLFDTVLPEGRRRIWWRWVVKQLAALAISGGGERVARLKGKVRRLLRRSAESSPTKDAFFGRFVELHRSAFAAASEQWNRDQSCIDFRIVLFRAAIHEWAASYETIAEDYGWRRYAGEHLSIVDVPGGHTSLLDMPHVDEVSREAQRRLDGGRGVTRACANPATRKSV